jgi:glutamate/tyrosine decarboxylase-like PLP-dependent enzyme
LRDLLAHAAARAADYREGAAELPVFPRSVDPESVRRALGPLPDEPTPAPAVVDELVDIVEPALVATTGPRYFGFVVGGALDAATAADVLTTGWDQLAFNAVTSPAAAVVEDVAGGWLKEAQLSKAEGAEVVNDVVLNQVVVRFGDDRETDRVVDAVQRSGECWMGATTWHGLRLMRISVSSWRTTEADVNRSVAAILAAMAGDGNTSESP